MNYNSFLFMVTANTNIFLECHYQISLYLRYLFTHSQITHLEINIVPEDFHSPWNNTSNPYACVFFITLTGSQEHNYKTIEWMDEPLELLSLYNFKDTYLDYDIEYLSYDHFLKKLYLKFPLLNNQEFLSYMSIQLQKKKDDISFHRFNSCSLPLDLLDFMGKGIQSYFLQNSLNNTLSIKNDFFENKQKI